MRVIVSGPRNFSNKDYIFRILDIIIKKLKEQSKELKINSEKIEIVQGGASGVDTIADMYAKNRDYKCTEFPADWKNNGRAAGPIRNKQMAKYSDVLIAFVPGEITKGTLNMINVSKGLCKVRIIVKRIKNEDNKEKTQIKRYSTNDNII